MSFGKEVDKAMKIANALWLAADYAELGDKHGPVTNACITLGCNDIFYDALTLSADRAALINKRDSPWNFDQTCIALAIHLRCTAEYGLDITMGRGL